MDAKRRNEIGLGYRGRLRVALDTGDYAGGAELIGTLAKEFLMMQRTLRRIITALAAPTLDEFSSAQNEIVARFENAAAAGDGASARAAYEELEEQHERMHDMVMRWFAELLSTAARIYGEEGLERILRKSGEEFKQDFEKWAAMTPEQLVEASAWLQLSHPHGWMQIDEDDEKYTLHQGCGTGGRMIGEGRFDAPDGYARSGQAAGYSASKAGMPTYCLHCTVWNTLQSTEWFGRTPWVIEHPLNDSCSIHVYKDQRQVPKEYLDRLDLTD
jgi:hypothetical protein